MKSNYKFTISKALKHLWLVTKHKWLVLVHCFKCGLIWRGLVHDLSKLSPSEFIESVKYFHGGRSPIGLCRRDTGLSNAWLHHKGRNKHHIEYWYDVECEIQPLVPYKYAVECICDKLAATKTYNGKNYTPDKALLHWERHGCFAVANEKTKRFIERVFTDLKENGEGYILNKKYMKKTYREICLSE